MRWSKYSGWRMCDHWKDGEIHFLYPQTGHSTELKFLMENQEFFQIQIDFNTIFDKKQASYQAYYQEYEAKTIF